MGSLLRSIELRTGAAPRLGARRLPAMLRITLQVGRPRTSGVRLPDGSIFARDLRLRRTL